MRFGFFFQCDSNGSIWVYILYKFSFYSFYSILPSWHYFDRFWQKVVGVDFAWRICPDCCSTLCNIFWAVFTKNYMVVLEKLEREQRVVFNQIPILPHFFPKCQCLADHFEKHGWLCSIFLGDSCWLDVHLIKMFPLFFHFGILSYGLRRSINLTFINLLYRRNLGVWPYICLELFKTVITPFLSSFW